MRMRAAVLPIILAICTLQSAAPASAGDGIIEINQTSANQIGNDLHQITSPGNYLLTSDLSVPDGDNGISISADDVTLDLNGFSIIAEGQTIAFSDGIQMGNGTNIEIRNGSVKGFSRYGVFSSGPSSAVRVIDVRTSDNAISGIELQGSGMLIRGCSSTNNGSGGIRGGANSLATGNISRDNSGTGLLLGSGSGYGGNIIAGNGTNVSGGLAIACNVIGTARVCP